MVGGTIQWLIVEGILACVIGLALWGIPKIVKDGEAAKWVTAIVVIAVGGLMLLLLLRYAGVA